MSSEVSSDVRMGEGSQILIRFGRAVAQGVDVCVRARRFSFVGGG